MTKEEAKRKLAQAGYTVIDDNSVVTVVVAPEVSMKNAIKDVKEKLYSWGYNASFAIKQHKNAAEMASKEEPEDEDVQAVEDVDVSEAAEVADVVKTVLSKEEETPSKEETADTKKNENEDADEDEYFDEEDSDMLLTESSIQFSLEDFGLDF